MTGITPADLRAELGWRLWRTENAGFADPLPDLTGGREVISAQFHHPPEDEQF